jgi:hypothetical protein
VREWERLWELKGISKLIKLEEEINGIIEETLEEDESDIKDIHNYIYICCRYIYDTTMNQLSKGNKN